MCASAEHTIEVAMPLPDKLQYVLGSVVFSSKEGSTKTLSWSVGGEGGGGLGGGGGGLGGGDGGGGGRRGVARTPGRGAARAARAAGAGGLGGAKAGSGGLCRLLWSASYRSSPHCTVVCLL